MNPIDLTASSSDDSDSWDDESSSGGSDCSSSDSDSDTSFSDSSSDSDSDSDSESSVASELPPAVDARWLEPLSPLIRDLEPEPEDDPSETPLDRARRAFPLPIFQVCAVSEPNPLLIAKVLQVWNVDADLTPFWYFQRAVDLRNVDPVLADHVWNACAVHITECGCAGHRQWWLLLQTLVGPPVVSKFIARLETSDTVSAATLLCARNTMKMTRVNRAIVDACPSLKDRLKAFADSEFTGAPRLTTITYESVMIAADAILDGGTDCVETAQLLLENKFITATTLLVVCVRRDYAAMLGVVLKNYTSPFAFHNFTKPGPAVFVCMLRAFLAELAPGLSPAAMDTAQPELSAWIGRSAHNLIAGSRSGAVKHDALNVALRNPATRFLVHWCMWTYWERRHISKSNDYYSASLLRGLRGLRAALLEDTANRAANIACLQKTSAHIVVRAQTLSCAVAAQNKIFVLPERGSAEYSKMIGDSFWYYVKTCNLTNAYLIQHHAVNFAEKSARDETEEIRGMTDIETDVFFFGLDTYLQNLELFGIKIHGDMSQIFGPACQVRGLPASAADAMATMYARKPAFVGLIPKSVDAFTAQITTDGIAAAIVGQKRKR